MCGGSYDQQSRHDQNKTSRSDVRGGGGLYNNEVSFAAHNMQDFT